MDGLPPGEGVFLLCTFWLADNYALQGKVDAAHGIFERLLALQNDLGLLSEEYDPRQGRMLGNFPQAFSHVSLINTARNLTAGNKGPAGERGKRHEPCHSAPSARREREGVRALPATIPVVSQRPAPGGTALYRDNAGIAAPLVHRIRSAAFPPAGRELR